MKVEHQHPVEDERGFSTHPAYGCVTVTRLSGGRGRLFGSDFQHQHYIQLTISQAKEERAYGKNLHYKDKQLIEVYLSESQWASIVSSIGMGRGVPCTLNWFNGQPIPQIAEPVVTPQKHFEEDLKRTFQNALDTLDEVKAIVEETKLSAKAKKGLISMVENAIMHLTKNLPFVHKTVGEYMEDTVAKGKAEIEAYGKDLLLRLGQENANLPITIEYKKD